MADLPPPPDPAAVQAMMDAKTPNEAAMARVKMSSQEIWELYQQAEDFRKQDAFLELELKNAWTEYEKTKAPLEEAKKRRIHDLTGASLYEKKPWTTLGMCWTIVLQNLCRTVE